MRAMAAATLGPAGASVVSVTYLALSYALLTAYSAKVADLTALTGGAVPPEAAQAALSAAFFGLIFAGGERAVESVNAALTKLLLLLFAGILAGTAARADWGTLAATADWARDQRRVPVAGARAAPRRPIGGASARARAAPERAPPRQVYHDLVPVICRLLDGDRPRITRAVLAGARPMRPARARPAATGARQAAARLRAAGHRVAGCGRARSATVPARPPPRARAAGSAVPLAMFLAFNAATLAVPAPAGDPLAHLLRTGGPALGAAVAVFSLFAICTSFACTAIGAPPRRRPAAPSSRSMRRAHGRAPQACRRRWRARRTPCARPPGAARAARPPRTRPGSARRCSRWRSGRRWRSAWRTRAPSWRCSRRAAAPGSSCDGRRAARAACARSRTGAGCLPCGVGWPGFSGLWVRWWSRRMAVPWERAPCMLWTCGRGGGVRLHQA